MLCPVGFPQKKALERVSELENENAVLKEAADRRSKVLHQSRSFINAYLQVGSHHLCEQILSDHLAGVECLDDLCLKVR